MTHQRPQEPLSPLEVILGTFGFAMAGLAPLIMAAWSVWDYIEYSYSVSRSGDPMEGPWGVILAVVLVLVGIALLAYAFRFYRRHHPR